LAFPEHGKEHKEGEMVLLQTNIDDMNPEFCPYIGERLLAAGAHDVFWIPILMKKGRPGFLLNVLTHAKRLDAIEQIVFEETTTLGIRYIWTECKRLERYWEEASTPWGVIRVKVGKREGKIVQFAPEFADCEAAAKAHQVPIKAVYDAAKRGFDPAR